ncbi:transporter [Coemansia sp. RSA 2336]|nr:transporter [Coemansia sp. RSA 2336]
MDIQSQSERAALIDTTSYSYSSLSSKDQQCLAEYIRKCDRRLMFYLCVGYATDTLNKMALANAKVSGLSQDLHLQGSDINWALGMYYVGCFFFQLPSNLLLKKTQPRLWLSGSLFCWSLVTIATAFVQSPKQLIWLRFWFGAVQSGYLTGSMYYISFWYPRDIVRRRMGFFFASAGLGGIAVGPLCSLLSSVKVYELLPWQNIFIVVGMISLSWSLLGPFMLENYPDQARFLSHDEQQLILRIMVHQNTVASDQQVRMKQVKMALADYKVWMWTIIDFCANAATQVNGMFGPSIIENQGYSPQAAQALTALTNFMAFSGMASISYFAHLLHGSSNAIALSNLLTCGGFIMALFSSNSGAHMAALFLFSFASPQPAAHAPAWEMANLQGNTKPAMAAAITSAFGGLGPLATAFVYREQDRPRYILGHSVCLVMTILCLLVTLVLRIALNRENMRRDHRHQLVAELTDEEIQDLADNHPDFRYQL